MDLLERIVFVMKLNNLSASAFADKIDVQRSSISHILSGRNKPSLELIQKILTAFPKVNPDWLLTGKTSVDNNSLTSSFQKNEDEEKNSLSPTPTKTTEAQKQIKKIVVFYTDNTFDEFNK